MRSTDRHHHFIITLSHEGLLADMMLTHMVHDFYLIGPEVGCHRRDDLGLDGEGQRVVQKI